MTKKELVILGFMTFALFVGAGNIIFPPFIGLRAGGDLWSAASGFLATGVGLPVISLIAMARCGGDIGELTKPAGKTLGLMLSVVCYLALGPLFATPRTATVSFEAGINPLFSGHLPLSLFSGTFFLLVILCSLNPARLLHLIGKFLSPMKIIALGLLGAWALTHPAGKAISTFTDYQQGAFSLGMVNGYLTMDALAAVMFSMIIVGAIRQHGETRQHKIVSGVIVAGLIAGAGLTYVYVSLFYLGAFSLPIASGATNGADILIAYVNYAFGYRGMLLLTFIITLACLVTAIGLTSTCAAYFAQVTKFSCKKLVIGFALFSMLISNLGLTEIIKISLPALTSIYPPFIVLIMAAIVSGKNARPVMVYLPCVLTSLIIGCVQSFVPASAMPGFMKNLPLFDEKLAWVLPTLCVGTVCFAIIGFRAVKQKVSEPEVLLVRE